MALGIGSKVWLSEMYGKRRELTVTSETSRSWVVTRGYNDDIKVPKNHTGPSLHLKTNTGMGKTLWLDQTAMEQEDWVGKNYWKIRDLVGQCHDYETLKKVAELLGYQEEKSVATS